MKLNESIKVREPFGRDVVLEKGTRLKSLTHGKWNDLWSLTTESGELFFYNGPTFPVDREYLPIGWGL